MTARDLITATLRSIRVLGVGDYLEAEDANDALARLNDWIDGLALERLTMYCVDRTLVPLTAGKPSYTIGSGGEIDMIRPTAIEHAGLIFDVAAAPPYEKPIEVMTDQRWQSVRLKSMGSPYISGVYYDHSWTPGPMAPPQPPVSSPPNPGQMHGLGVVWVWPIPSVGNTALVLYTPAALTEFATLDTDYTFAPGYRRFLRTNLAAEIASEYGKQLTSDQVMTARLAKAAIKRGNVRPGELRCDPAIVRGGDYFDWRTGESR
jgi:hypothetical protein